MREQNERRQQVELSSPTSERFTAPENTGQKQDTRFKPGESGNPAGRPKGSRNRLSETFLSALAVDFDQHGIGVIERVRMERPHDYLRIVVGALPKDMNMSLSTRQRPLEFMTDAELTAILRDSEQFLAAPQDE